MTFAWPAAITDVSVYRLDRVELYRKLGEARNWPPQVISEIPLASLLALSGQRLGGAHWNAADQLAYRNRKRVEQGLPPIAPRKRP